MLEHVPKQFIRNLPVLGFPFTGFLIGVYLDRRENERMTRFRDKSALYGREKKPGEPPSWPLSPFRYLFK